jgi:CheY-like chemotaxis protein
MRILVVEDDVKTAGLLDCGMLKEGHAADVARHGDDALWMARAVEYAIVLDLLLPGIDGFEVCLRLREGGVWTPVLMLTARDSVEDRDEGAGFPLDFLPRAFERFAREDEARGRGATDWGSRSWAPSSEHTEAQHTRRTVRETAPRFRSPSPLTKLGAA